MNSATVLSFLGLKIEADVEVNESSARVSFFGTLCLSLIDGLADLGFDLIQTDFAILILRLH